MRAYLICYDIADPRRLGRVHRATVREALPVQYSVYLYEGSTRELRRFLAALEAIIEPLEDDVRAYPLPARQEVYRAGRGQADGIGFEVFGCDRGRKGEGAADGKASET